MRFKFDGFPTSPDFTPDEQWHCLDFPPPHVAQIKFVPEAAAVSVALYVAWQSLTPVSVVDGPAELVLQLAIATVFLFACVLPIHELLHAAAHPPKLRWRGTVLGFSWRQGAAYAYYDSDLSRRRYLVVLLLPFIGISVVPILVYALSGTVAPLWLVLACTLNGVGSSVDIVQAFVLWRRIPAATVVREKGTAIYWRSAYSSESR